MPAKSPEEVCSLFKQYMSEGDIDGVLSLYDPKAVFLDKSGEEMKGEEGLRQNLAPFVDAKARFDFNINQIIQTDGIALMHTRWNVSGPQPMSTRSRLPVVSRTVPGAGLSAIHLPSARQLRPRVPPNQH